MNISDNAGKAFATQNEIGKHSDSDEFTLRSNFAKRTSHFASATESELMRREHSVEESATLPNAAHPQHFESLDKNCDDDEEVADIEETLRVIDSARRMLKTSNSSSIDRTDQTIKAGAAAKVKGTRSNNQLHLVGDHLTNHQSSIATLSNSRHSSYKPTFGVLRDMSKETLKHHSSVDERAELNANDVT